MGAPTSEFGAKTYYLAENCMKISRGVGWIRQCECAKLNGSIAVCIQFPIGKTAKWKQNELSRFKLNVHLLYHPDHKSVKRPNLTETFSYSFKVFASHRSFLRKTKDSNWKRLVNTFPVNVKRHMRNKYSIETAELLHRHPSLFYFGCKWSLYS